MVVVEDVASHRARGGVFVAIRIVPLCDPRATVDFFKCVLPLVKEALTQELPGEYAAQVVRQRLSGLFGEGYEHRFERARQEQLDVFGSLAEIARIDLSCRTERQLLNFPPGGREQGFRSIL